MLIFITLDVLPALYAFLLLLLSFLYYYTYYFTSLICLCYFHFIDFEISFLSPATYYCHYYVTISQCYRHIFTRHTITYATFTPYITAAAILLRFR